jgi:hypothetical protein
MRFVNVRTGLVSAFMNYSFSPIHTCLVMGLLQDGDSQSSGAMAAGSGKADVEPQNEAAFMLPAPESGSGGSSGKHICQDLWMVALLAALLNCWLP